MTSTRIFNCLLACLALAVAGWGDMVLARTSGSDGSWQSSPSAPAGAPNIIIILMDDVGFGSPSGFGGPIETPVFDALAGEGLSYNRFHTTSVCSPTRAALLTGRNQHRSNFGIASGGERSQPGYTGIWPRSTASLAKLLVLNGYSTAAIGKWHNTPNWESSPVGPFDRWPTGLGFEYFYGFMGGEADQYAPILYRNTTPVTPGGNDYHFTTDIANDAISWIHTHQALDPGKPYFLYFAPGAAHAPHQVPREWIERYRGRFDMGWDKLREQTFDSQKRLGAVPVDAKLTVRPAELPAWDSLPDDARRLAARQMETYAGFLTHADHETGRMIEAARAGPGGDNLLIFYIMGDNGASAEGGMFGSDHNLTDIFYGFGADDVSTQLSRADELGSDKLDNHFAVPWSWAMNTPFQWTKQIASHLGGTRNPLVVSWPGRLADRGQFRSQWTHVIDIVPTIFQLAGIYPPSAVDGVPQMSFDGTSFAATLVSRDPGPTRRTQYFEMFGNRAIYHDGWMASARHSLPWQLSGRDPSFANDRWELYHLDRDFSQAVDVASAHPEKLVELKALFVKEARRNGVLPMVAEIGNAVERPSLASKRRAFEFHRDTAPVPSLSGAPMLMGPHKLFADIEIGPAAPAGAILSNGAREGGFVLFVDRDGHLIYENNFGGKSFTRVRSAAPLVAGRHRVETEVSRGSTGFVVTLRVDGAVAASAPMARIGPPSYLGAWCVGRSCGSPVGRGYSGEFAFPGKIVSVKVEQ